MNDPIQRLKAMPWAGLFQVAALTTAIAIALDLLLIWLLFHSPLTQAAFRLLLAHPLDAIMNVVVYVGIGALAVYLMETVFRKLVINIANLWGLIFCLAVVMTIASMLATSINLPSFLVGASQGSLMGLVIGVFATTWRHWRYSSAGSCRRCR